MKPIVQTKLRVMETKKQNIDYWDLISEKDKKEILSTPKRVYQKDTLLNFLDYCGSNILIDNVIKKLQQIKSDYSGEYDYIELDVDRGYDYAYITIAGNILETEEQFLERSKTYAKAYYEKNQRALKKQETEKALYEKLKKKFEKNK